MGSRLNKRYVYDPETKKMIEVQMQPRSAVHLIMPDIPDFVSPIDKTIINGRAGLREHNKRHRVTNVADYKETWKKAEQQREAILRGEDRRRTERIVRAFNDLSEGRVRPRPIRERDFEKF